MKQFRLGVMMVALFGMLATSFAEPNAQGYIESLREDDEATALVAQNALVQLGAEAVRPLEKALNDGNFKVRRRAAEALGRIGPPAKHAAPELVSLLADPQFEVRAAADKALVQMGDDAVPALASAIKGGKEGMRKIVLSTLSRCGPKGIPILINLLKKDESPFIRASAAEALGSANPVTPEIIDALIVALSDLEEGVRGAAADALGQQGTKASAAIGPLLTMEQADNDAVSRKKATDNLARIGPATKESMAGLIAGFHHPSVEVRQKIILAMAQSSIPFPDAMPVLTSALKDSDAGVRLRVVLVSASLGGTGSASLPILKQAVSDSSVEVRTAAIEALGRLKDAAPEAAAELGKLLNNPNPLLRQNVIRALANLGMSGLPGLIQALSDPYSALSDEAAKAIVRLGPDAVPSLEALKQSPDPALKKKAQDLLNRIQHKPARKRR